MTANNTRFHAQLTGWCFILAALTSIVGLKLYDPLLTHANYLEAAKFHSPHIVSGAILELLLVVSATGTGLLLYPVLKRQHESLGLAYLSFRLLEVVFIMIGIVGVLVALSISDQYVIGELQDKSQAKGLMDTFIALHKWTFMLGPNFMLAVNTYLYSYALCRLSFVPKTLARFGLVAAIFIMIAAILELFGVIEQISLWGILLALPIALYEMTLAVYFILKRTSLN